MGVNIFAGFYKYFPTDEEVEEHLPGVGGPEVPAQLLAEVLHAGPCPRHPAILR